MTVREHWRILLLLALGLVTMLLLPISATQVRNFPKAETEYIRRVFGDNTVGQAFRTRFASDSIDVLVRSEVEREATLVAADRTGAEIGRAQFLVGPEDQWIAVPFSPRLGSGEHVITFSTFPETTQEEAILLRYQPLSSSYESGHMIVNGEDSYGDLAFRVNSRLPFWQSLLIGQKRSAESWVRSALLILTGVVIGVLLWLLRLVMPRMHQPALVGGALLILVLVGVIIRLPVLENMEGVFGGDVFNYLSKAQAPLVGADPFAADPRKGPLFSVLLMPGFSTSDPIAWARWMSLLAAVGTTVLLVGLARQFDLPWGLALGSGLLLTVNQDLIWESLNGLANTLYVATIVGAFLLYLLARRQWAQWMLAVMCGLIFLTRFEGGTFAVVLLAAVWWREKVPWRRMVMLVAVTVAIMLIPQLSLLWSGSSGVRSLEDVNSDSGLFVVRSMEDLASNMGRFKRFLTSAWLLPPVGADRFVVPGFLLGVVGGAAASWSRLKWPKISRGYKGLLGGFLLLGVIGLILINSAAAREYLVAVPWVLIGVGVVPWWRSRSFDATVVALAMLIQVAVIVMILPKPRYFLPLVPFFSLLMVFGVRSFWRQKDNPYLHVVPLILVGILASFFYVDGRHTVQDRLEHHNLKAAEVTPMVEAMRFLRAQGQRVGLNVDLEQSVTTYLPEEHRYQFPGGEELAWIEETGVMFLVERNDDAVWQSARSHPEVLELHEVYETDFGDSQVLVYRVHQQRLRDLLEGE